MTTAITATAHAASPRIERSPSYWKQVFRKLLRNKLAVAAAIVLLVLLALAIFAPWLMPGDPYKSSIMTRLKPIGTENFPLGSDELGRDMLSRLMLGGRLSLFMGITPVIIAFVIGSAIGIFAGFAGGLTNSLIMRFIDILYAFPSVLLAIALSGTLGAGIGNSLISLTIVFIPQIVRVAESVTTQVRTQEFVEAARASGASSLRIVNAQILNNVLGPIFVFATSLISVSMILASGLSFLGLGVKPPEPEWGLMLNTLRTAIYIQPWVAALPGLMIFITSISFNLFADGLRQSMEIKD